MKTTFFLSLLLVATTMLFSAEEQLLPQEPGDSLKIITLLGPKTVSRGIGQDYPYEERTEKEMICIVERYDKKATINTIAELVKYRYLLGEPQPVAIDVFARRKIQADNETVYYYSPSLQNESTIESVIQRYKTSEFYVVPQDRFI